MKIFVTDIDGTTLFDGSNLLPKENELAYKKILKKAKLIVASGRTTRNLYSIFKNNDEIIYIGENGNIVVYKNEIIYLNKFKKEEANKILSFASLNKDNYILVSTPFSCYFYKPNKKIRVDDELEYRYENIEYSYFVNNILKDLDIIKISIYRKEMDYIFYTLYKNAKKEFEFAEVFDANNSWIDFSPLGGNKGNALKFVFDKFNLDFKDAYIFGDGENDISMLKLSKNSYSPNRSLNSVKEISKNIYSSFPEVVSSLLSEE